VFEGDTSPDSSGLTPAQQLAAISSRVHAFVQRQYAILTGQLLPALALEGIRVGTIDDLTADQRAAAAAYFRDEVLPALTPLAIDFARPFPMLSSLSLNLTFLLAPDKDGEEPRLALVQVPPLLSRLVRLAGEGGPVLVPLEDVIRAEAQALFPGQAITEAVAIRLARDSELELDDEGGLSYLEAIEEELRKRRRKDVVRLEIEAGASEVLVDVLARQLQLEADDIYRVPGPLDPRMLMSLVELPGHDRLRDRPIKPVAVLGAREQGRIFDLIDERDLLFHHPYESFDPVVLRPKRTELTVHLVALAWAPVWVDDRGQRTPAYR